MCRSKVKPILDMLGKGGGGISVSQTSFFFYILHTNEGKIIRNCATGSFLVSVFVSPNQPRSTMLSDDVVCLN